jgi:peptide/nickel transport system substrate-binding protein
MRRRAFLAGVASAAGLARPALGHPPRVLRFVPDGSLASPDPVLANISIARNHGYMVWDTLYGQTRKGVPMPQMAGSHEVSADRLAWRFALRDGLRFHDGEPVLARDCAASVWRWARRRGYGRKLEGLIEEIRALDDRRFEIRLQRPFPLMLRALGTDHCFIMPERIAATDPHEAIGEYIGSGPFRFLAGEFVAGSRAAYARFEGYVPVEDAPEFTAGGKLVKFDRVEWQSIADPAEAAEALRRGEVDWLQNPLVDLLAGLRKSPGVKVLLNDTVGVQPMIALNHLHPPFNNPRLLRALLPAIDQNEFLQAAMGSEPELFRVGTGVFTPGQPMANAAGLEVLTGPRDAELARSLVQDSGYAGEQVVVLSPSDNPAVQALAQTAQRLFERVGLRAELVSTDWHGLLQRRASRDPVEAGGWSAFCTAYEGLSVASPANHMPLRGNGANAWFGWPDSPRIEALRDAWYEAPDLAGQRALCEEIQRAALDELPYIPLGQWYNPTALRSDIRDVVKAPFPIFWGARREA